jgi:hypothetical protein
MPSCFNPEADSISKIESILSRKTGFDSQSTKSVQRLTDAGLHGFSVVLIACNSAIAWRYSETGDKHVKIDQLIVVDSGTCIAKELAEHDPMSCLKPYQSLPGSGSTATLIGLRQEPFQDFLMCGHWLIYQAAVASSLTAWRIILRS